MAAVPRRRLARYLLADGPTGKEGDIDGHRTLADPFVFAASASAGPQTLLKIEGAVNNRFKAGDSIFRGSQLVGILARNTDWDRKSPLEENTHVELEAAYTLPGNGWTNKRLTVAPLVSPDDATHGYHEVSAQESEEMATSSLRFEDAEDFRFKISGGAFEHKNDERIGITITGPSGETQVVEDVSGMPGATVEILFVADVPVDDPAAEFVFNGDDVVIALVAGEGSYLMPLDEPANFHVKGTQKYKAGKPLHIKIRISG